MTESQGALNQITELVDNMPSFSTVCCPGNRPLLERRGVKQLKCSNIMLFIISWYVHCTEVLFWISWPTTELIRLCQNHVDSSQTKSKFELNNFIDPDSWNPHIYIRHWVHFTIDKQVRRREQASLQQSATVADLQCSILCRLPAKHATWWQYPDCPPCLPILFLWRASNWCHVKRRLASTSVLF